jgi:hypothetical protein
MSLMIVPALILEHPLHSVISPASRQVKIPLSYQPLSLGGGPGGDRGV